MAGVERPTFRLIGPFRVERADAVDITPRGKRSKALLAMLALAPKGTRSRIWLQDKLWSGRGATQGAASLRQELSELRKHFGAVGLDLLAVDREIVRLDIQHIHLDIENLDSKVKYQDLLEGFNISDPEFEDWLRDERRHWAATYEEHTCRQSHVEVIHPKTDTDHGLTFARPSIGLFGDFTHSLDPIANSAGDFFLDLIACSIQSLDAVDVIDLRFGQQLQPPWHAEGPDWILQAKIATHGDSISVSVSLRTVDESRILWTQVRHFDRGMFIDANHIKLGAFVNEVVFVALDQITNPRQLWDEERHEAARLALGAIYEIFRLQDADLEAAEEKLLRAYEIERKSSYLGWLLYINLLRLGERRVERTGAFDDKMRAYARRAIEVNAYNPITLALTAHAHSFIFHDYEYALELANRAVEANPMLAISWDLRALTLGYLGEVDKGYADALRARKLGGPTPYRYFIDTTCCILSTLNGRFEEGIRYGQRALAQQPDFLPALRYTAACQGHLGRTAAAVGTLERLRQWEPDFSLELLTDENYPIAGVLGVSVVKKGLSRVGLTARPN